MHLLRAKIYLTGIYHSELPDVELWISDKCIYKGQLAGERCFEINEMFPESEQVIRVLFTNKKNTDTVNGLDKAVVVNRITFNDIDSNRFVWAGEYYPIYPEPWASEQEHKLEPMVKYCSYLGWNGQWILPISIPIFTWIHKTENFGWLYD